MRRASVLADTPCAHGVYRGLACGVDVAGSTGEVTPELILLGIWEQKEAGAGHKLLSTLGFTDDFAAELRQLVRRHNPTQPQPLQ